LREAISELLLIEYAIPIRMATENKNTISFDLPFFDFCSSMFSEAEISFLLSSINFINEVFLFERVGTSGIT
jgi:hypothetical protein